ncbi:MAG: thiamine-monophosphate kinase, partial [Thermoproteota archaeon]|nr:thiamine-monophosphate kinase [Thermoproteota archaeon]
LVLYGGEEYEIVTTIKSDSWSLAYEAIKEAGGNLIRIGEVTEETKIVFMHDGKEETVLYKGWEHFKSTK